MVNIAPCYVVLIHRDLLVGACGSPLQVESDLLDILLKDIVVQDAFHGSRCST